MCVCVCVCVSCMFCKGPQCDTLNGADSRVKNKSEEKKKMAMGQAGEEEKDGGIREAAKWADWTGDVIGG